MNKKLLIFIIFLISIQITYSEDDLGAFYMNDGGWDILDYPGTYYRQALHWNQVQPQEGNPDYFDFNSGNMIRIKRILNAGKSAVPSIMADVHWATQDPPYPECSGSTPPIDMQSEFDPQFGHSELYYNFVYEAANYFEQNYPGQIDIYVIENEQTARKFWCASMEEYVWLVATAEKAIHDAAPNARIADGGMASNSWGYPLVQHVLETEGVDAAIEFYNNYYNASFLNNTPIHTEQQLMNKLNNNQQTIDNTNYLMTNLPPYLDIFNMHFYEPPEMMEYQINFVREMTGMYAVMNNELGPRVRPEWDQWGDRELLTAQILVEKMIIAQKMEMEAVMWFGVENWDHFIIGFVNENNGQLREQIVEAYATAMELLDREMSEYQDLSDSSIYRHRLIFSDNMVDAIWSHQQGNSIDVPNDCTAYDILGDEITSPSITLTRYTTYLVCPIEQSEPPVIDENSITVSQITETTATIEWDTNIESTSIVFYDYESHPLPDQYLYSQTGHSGIHHTVQLTNLNPDTTYHFRVVSEANGDVDYSSDYSFTTIAESELCNQYNNLRIIDQNNNHHIESAELLSSISYWLKGDISTPTFTSTLGSYFYGDDLGLLVNPPVECTYTVGKLSGLEISNLIPDYYEISKIQEGDNYYIDQPYFVYDVPDQLEGLDFDWIKTANKNKTIFDNPWVEFDVNKESTVYVAIDSRGLGDPQSWLMDEGWTESDVNITVSVAGDRLVNNTIFYKRFDKGHVTLGGNEDKYNMYFLILKTGTPPPLS